LGWSLIDYNKQTRKLLKGYLVPTEKKKQMGLRGGTFRGSFQSQEKTSKDMTR